MSTIKHGERTIRKPCRDCGRTDGLYWWHLDYLPAGKRERGCKDHPDAMTWYLGNAEGTPHVCRENAAEQHPAEHEAEPEPSYSPAPVAVLPTAEAKPLIAAPNAGAAMEALHVLMSSMAPTLDESQIRRIVADQADSITADLMDRVNARVAELNTPLKVEVTYNGEVRKIDGTHRVLPMVLASVSVRNHVLMVGPAGTGKSTLAEHVAESLGLDYYAISLSPQTPASALIGYLNATGAYCASLFRKAYESGGVFHFDEFDNGNASILATINAALSNGQMGFPDGMVRRHPDFVVMASANTYGLGPDRQYVGRQQIDAATLDRFDVHDVPVDEALERAICDATGLSATKVTDVLLYVRSLRKAAERNKMTVMFSPRASVGVCKLVGAGMSVTDAIKVRVRKGISDQDWSKVSSGIIAPSF